MQLIAMMLMMMQVRKSDKVAENIQKRRVDRFLEDFVEFFLFCLSKFVVDRDCSEEDSTREQEDKDLRRGWGWNRLSTTSVEPRHKPPKLFACDRKLEDTHQNSTFDSFRLCLK